MDATLARFYAGHSCCGPEKYTFAADRDNHIQVRSQAIPGNVRGFNDQPEYASIHMGSVAPKFPGITSARAALSLSNCVTAVFSATDRAGTITSTG